MVQGSAGVSGGLIVRQQRRSSIQGWGSVLAILICASFLASCSSPPTLKALQPSTGQPHDVIIVDGTGRELAQIVWDADGPGEKVIPGGYQGAFMFSVPPNAVQGMSYKVKLQNSGGRSDPVTFTVPPSMSSLDDPRPPGPPYLFPAPRIDAVTIVGATFEPSGVRTTLYVQGANLDVGVVVSIQDSKTAPPVPVATTSHRVLRNDDWFGVSHDELGYPIYHYSSAIATAGLRPNEAHIWIVATNLDGTPSEPFEYVLPKDADTIDSDGDGLRDAWETNGYDYNSDGVVDVDLKALNADPYRRDVFLELDIMDNLKFPPGSTVFNAVKQMFESAPILNVGEAPGIHLEIDASGKPCLESPAGGDVCSFHTIHFDIGGQIPSQEPDPFGEPSEVRFSMLKKLNFDDNRRGNIYHYGIWGRHQGNGRGGFSDMGDDLVITFDEHGGTYSEPRTGIEALAHELGHDLGQLHAGTADFPAHKPNYLSVMSYNWLFRTAEADDVRLERATCLPFYYADAAAKEDAFGSVFESVNTIVDYSEGMAKELLRPMTSVAGSPSICGTTIDWSTVDSPYNMLKDFANWRALVFDGPANNGNLTP